MSSTPTTVVIIGGSGFWSEQNHIANILQVGLPLHVRLIGIVDPVNPSSMLKHINLQKLLERDHPIWLQPEKFSSIGDLFDQLPGKPTLVIIASNPDSHFTYARYCLENGIHILIDKPVVSAIRAASNVEQARSIQLNYNTLLDIYSRATTTKAVSILRRRTLPTFQRVAKELADYHNRYSQGITHLNLIVNNGVHKFPSEFISTGGAHGYHAGIGSLSHSAYHYIDVMTWFLRLAPGDARFLRIQLNSVKRVSDYIATNGIGPLQSVLAKSGSLPAEAFDLPEHIANAELDVSFTIEILNPLKAVIGHMNFVYCHTTFTPRITEIQHTGDHSNVSGGGRMSHIYLDVHQGALQTWQIAKNDIVFEGNVIRLEGRQHPFTTLTPKHDLVDSDAYGGERPLALIFEDLLNNLDKSTPRFEATYINDLVDERFTMKLYGVFYELIALELKHGKRRHSQMFDIQSYVD